MNFAHLSAGLILAARRTAVRLTVLLFVAFGFGLQPATAALPTPPGGPVLVITSSADAFGSFYPEMLRNEGLNHYAVADIGAVDASMLSAYDVVILAKMAIAQAQVELLTAWVTSGGNLIAMQPDALLAPLLGILPAGTSLSNAYLLVDTGTLAGNGIVGQTIQFHGSADRYTLNGAASLATLFSSAVTATSNPALTLRAVGTGQAAAFTYDLARSIVYTRQGNPAWATQERDGFAPIRSGDKFYGNAAGDPQADWIDLNKVAIPQADEQQRLLSNLITQMNLARKPLPRFWYFPNGKKAVVVMTGDDHGTGGTAGRFDQFKAASPAGCSVSNWECIRGTSYIYTSTPLSEAQAAGYNSEGFEVGIHINTGCANFTPTSLQNDYFFQIQTWQGKYSSLPAPVTQRHHCIVWSDWSSGATVQLSHGVRLDTSYYYWPPGWVGNSPGLFTGSAMPMRFSAIDGTLIDVYNAATQMTDESGQSYPYTVDTLLDRALGPEGYYGAYVVNAHTDLVNLAESDAVVASAKARSVPVVSSRQLLEWLDARNSSSYGALTWNGSVLGFSLTKASGANGLQGMLPNRSSTGVLSALSRGGNAVPFTVSTVKGIEYASFAADTGTYSAIYAADLGAPAVIASTPANGSLDVALAATPSATFSEAMNPSTITASTFELRLGGTLVAAAISYDAATRRATLAPAGTLTASTTYTATVKGGAAGGVKDLAGNALAADVVWSFTTAASGGGGSGGCPCSAWTASTVPTISSANDASSVELGVKFRANVSGFITGIRFYKGTGNSGTHTGSLWSAGGQLLATATFTNETATGWQQVNFATPVPIVANTVYVASYFAPNGRYAGDNGYFAATGVDNGPIRLLSNAESGGNGVYAYGGASSFPNSSYQSSNYWVDVVFATSTGPDTTPPTVISTTPIAGATAVATSTSVSANFSEPIDPATLGGTSFELRDAGGALVASTLSYDIGASRATLAPLAALNASTNYTVTVKGGTSGVKDLAGNPFSADFSWAFTSGLPSAACAIPVNEIVAENCRAGSPASVWDISGAGDASIQGFATQISVNRGFAVAFKVNTPASSYRFDIYRMGYYDGLGARKVATVLPSATLPQAQPECLYEAASGLVDCGNWSVSASWNVPANAASGIYFAKLVRADTGGASHIFFVVRNDTGTADLLFQTSDTTWQAYNDYGGNSLYVGAPAGRAYKVSYNRPFNTRAVDNGQDWVFNAEYPMVRWLESNGYHLSYATGVDIDRSANLLTNHKVFLSVGHDEYWSGAQRANVEAARNAGVNLAFFSGNEMFWKTRWEPSIDGSATPHRTLVTYKETKANAKIDPNAAWTGTWRDPRFSPPADGGRPENALTGTLFLVNTGTTSIKVPQADGLMRLWRNTSVATLGAGAIATMPDSTLGYEWDTDADNGFRPPGLIRMSDTTLTGADILLDFGSTYGSGTANHALTLYKHSSGALVFGAGTVQWSWGLDSTHDRGNNPADVRMQQATVNLLADMRAQPATLQAGLIAASASTDVTAPTSLISSPSAGSVLPTGAAVTISGTAIDAGGGRVGGVEVSVDAGATWRRATGRGAWTYVWTPTVAGAAVIRSRAADDSGNLESPSAGTGVSVGTDVTRPLITARSPGIGATNVSTAASVTATFNEAMLASSINTSTIELRDASNNLLTGTVSYSATTRRATLVPSPRLLGVRTYTATVRGGDAGSAVKDAAGNSLTASSSWSFTTAADLTAPTVSGISPASNATGVSRTATPFATFSESIDASTISSATVELRGPGGAPVAAAISYTESNRRATLRPSVALLPLTSYTMVVRGGGADPRVKDLAGNALAADRVWSFTTR